jgi:uncharacterized protein (UPF0335 family)
MTLAKELEQENFQLRARIARLQRIEQAAVVMSDQTEEVFWVKAYSDLMKELNK